MADTIAAIATPPGPGRRGAIRVSGPEAHALVRATFAGPGAAPAREARGFLTGRFDDGRGTQPMLLLWMPGPRSLTREDVAEFHLPGSPPLLAAALERLLALGARAARAGEFTRRAFENGRIDLARAEGVLALVQAESEGERRSASALLFGGLSDRVDALRAGLESLRALCEASLDFDESDTGHVPAEELEAGGRELARGIEHALRWEERRAPMAGEPRVVLAGAPNAGKSSLFNALAEEGSALVSAHPGTTRDGSSGTWRLGAGRARLHDAPGLEAATGVAEAEAQRLADAARKGAELVLWVVDGTRRDAAAMVGEAGELSGAPLLLAWSKADLAAAAARPPAELIAPAGPAARFVRCSAHSGEGLGQLARSAAELLGLAAEGGDGAAGGSSRELAARHREALRRAGGELASGLAERASGAPLDLYAESLRAATAALDEITGRTSSEELLDRIFARFCIGK